MASITFGSLGKMRTIFIVVVTCAMTLLLTEQCGTQHDPDPQTGFQEPDPEVMNLLYRARNQLQQGEYQLALSVLDSAKVFAPDFPEIYLLRGRIYTEINQFQTADSILQKALDLDPEYQGIWFRLGHNAFQQENYREALSYYIKEQEAFAKRGHRYSSEARSAVLVQMGRCYSRLGQIDSAVQIYEEVIAGDSTQSEAYADLGQLYKNEGDFERGLKYYRKAAELAPENLEYRYFYGYLLLQTGDPQAAAQVLEKVAKQQPWHYGAHYNLGLALLRLGQSEAGQAHLARADSLQDIDYDVATAKWTVRTFPDNTRRWIHLGDLYQKTGRYQEAKQAYQTALYLEPANSILRNKLANVYASLGNVEEAVEIYTAILEGDSSLVRVWINLGLAYAAAERRQMAKQAWEKALQQEPGHPVAARYLRELSVLD